MIMHTTNLFQGTLVRLTARRPNDAEQFAKWSEDSAYMRMLDTDFIYPQAPEDIPGLRRPSKDGMTFFLRTIAEDRLIGFVALGRIEWNNGACMLSIGIGDAEYRGSGYGTDALRLALNYAFSELNLYRVGLEVVSSNEPAIRAYQRAGFVHEGGQRCAVLRDGRRYDLLMMGILRDDWLVKQEGSKLA
jgi:RimJ/RimL family protein N-acetyltransferase